MTRRLLKSFTYAFNGIYAFIITGGNIHLHLIAGLSVITAGFYYKATKIEWAILIVCIGLVIAAEAINTSIEKLTDIVSPDFNKEAGKIKDIAAAAVLILAIMATIVAIIIFYPYCCK